MPRVISRDVFPDINVAKLKRGTGGRSSFNGQIVTLFGGSGFLARSVANRLSKVGAQMIFPYRGSFEEVKQLKVIGDLGQVLFFPFYLRDLDSLRKVMKYSNVVINLIGKDTETNRFSFNDVHVEGARNIARVAKEVGIKRFVHVSAMNVTPEPEGHLLKNGSQWLKSKYYGELAVREEFPEAIIIRPADIFGFDDHFTFYFQQWQRRKYRSIPLYKSGYDVYKMPVYMSDVAQGIANAITDDEAPGTTYEAIGPKRYEMRALIEYLNRITQKDYEEGYKIDNIRWTFLFRLRVSLFSNPKWFHKYPQISWEKLERECISDEPTGCPTLQDLGVKLTPIEDRWFRDLHMYKRHAAYYDEYGEYLPVEPAPLSPLPAKD